MTIQELAAKCSIECNGDAKLVWDKQDDWQKNANGYNCTLKYKGKRFSFDFWKGIALKGEPTAIETLSNLISTTCDVEYNNFEGFCADFGYDSDSRKAERIYKACERIARKLKAMFYDIDLTMVENDY